MALYDYFNAYATAVLIKSGSGERFPLWADVIPKGTANSHKTRLAGLESFPYLQNLQVRWNLGDYPIINATFTPTYEDSIKFLNGELIDWSATVLEVTYGYVGVGSHEDISKTSPTFSGITLKPQVRFGQDCSITLTAQGIPGFMLTRQTGNESRPDETRLESMNFIAKTLASAKPSRPCRVDIADVVKGGPVSDEMDLLVNQKVPYSSSYKSDYTKLADLAHEALCMIRFESEILRDGRSADVIKLIPRRAVSGTPDTNFVFVYRAFNGRADQTIELGPGVGIFPIMDVSSPTSHQWLPIEAMMGYSSTRTNASGKNNVSVVSPNDSSMPNSGNGPGFTATGKVYTSVPRYIQGMESEDSRVDAVISAETARAKQMAGVTLEIETLMNPDLRPGQLIWVLGVSDKMDGAYMVMELTHNYANGGASTSFTCLSNTIPLANQEGFTVTPVWSTSTGRLAAVTTTKPVDRKNPGASSETHDMTPGRQFVAPQDASQVRDLTPQSTPNFG